jgi:RNA polymerase sigma-70 factor (ECF subfamily)
MSPATTAPCPALPPAGLLAGALLRCAGQSPSASAPVHPDAQPTALPPDGAARDARDARLATLLAAAAGGSAQAFEDFYDASAAHARALARRLLRGPQREADIEDLLADAYFEAWRLAGRFDATRGSAVTWLLQIVRSRALDLLRRQAAHPTEPLPDETAEPSDDDDPATRLWQQQAGTRLQAALLRLSAPERWALGLAYFRELSHAQIAAATGLPLGTVKSHIQRAQSKLRQALAD